MKLNQAQRQAAQTRLRALVAARGPLNTALREASGLNPANPATVSAAQALVDANQLEQDGIKSQLSQSAFRTWAKWGLLAAMVVVWTVARLTAGTTTTPEQTAEIADLKVKLADAEKLNLQSFQLGITKGKEFAKSSGESRTPAVASAETVVASTSVVVKDAVVAVGAKKPVTPPQPPASVAASKEAARLDKSLEKLEALWEDLDQKARIQEARWGKDCYTSRVDRGRADGALTAVKEAREELEKLRAR